MDILNTKIKDILTEKNTKIRPENKKKNIEIQFFYSLETIMIFFPLFKE